MINRNEGEKALQREKSKPGYGEQELQRWRQICFPRCKSKPDDYLRDSAHFITLLKKSP